MYSIDAKTRKSKITAIKNAFKNLDKTLKEENVACFIGDMGPSSVPRISSGSVALDAAIGGGIPMGRIIEMFGGESSGKSATSLKIIASAQKAGLTCAYIDMEHTFDPNWSKTLGIDISGDSLIVSQPMHLQQSFYIIDQLIDAGVDLIVVDSTAALTPKEELEGEPAKATVGLIARYMSQFLRRITPKLAKSNCSTIWLNQVRDNVGVMYGCFHEDTNIYFADGTLHTIKEVVNNKLEGPVLSYNQETNKFEPAKIINWFINGTLQKDQLWYSFKTTTAGAKNGINGFTCTGNHQILKADGNYVSAETLHVGDQLVSWYTKSIEHNDIYRDIIYGSLLGDGTLTTRAQTTAGLKLANSEQIDYINWKINKLKDLNFTNVNTSNGRILYTSKYLVELQQIKNKFYITNNKYRQIPNNLKLTPLMAAVWFMDDGFIHHSAGAIAISRIKHLPPDELNIQIERITNMLSEFTQCDKNNFYYRNNKFVIKHEAFVKFCELISPFVIPSMQYKLLDEFKNKYIDFNSGNLDKVTQEQYFVTITSIDTTSKRKLRSKTKYDIEIENNHCYLVGGNKGIVVHNSTESTPGGKALKFYSSLRLRLSKGEEGRLTEKSSSGEERQVGLHIKATAVKNKTAAPYAKAQYKIYWDGRVVDDTDEIAEIAITKGLIPKYNAAGELNEKGRNYKWDSEPKFLAKSKAEVPEQLRKFPKVKEELLKIINDGAMEETAVKYGNQINTNDDSTMTEEEFENMLENDIKNAKSKIDSEAEEISEGNWDDV